MSTESIKKRKAGRPKASTPEIKERILCEVIAGAFVGEACQEAGIGYSTLVREEIQDGDFGRLLARARVAGADLHVEEADRLIREAKTHEDIARARELAIHRRWRASKLVPAYSDRIGVEVQGEVTHKIAEPIELARRVWHILHSQREQLLDPSVAIDYSQAAALPAPVVVKTPLPEPAKPQEAVVSPEILGPDEEEFG